MTFANAKVPATLAVGRGVALDATEGEAAAWLGAAEDGLDAVVSEPQAASARAAATKAASVTAQMDFLRRERFMAPIPPIV